MAIKGAFLSWGPARETNYTCMSHTQGRGRSIGSLLTFTLHGVLLWNNHVIAVLTLSSQSGNNKQVEETGDFQNGT